MLAQQVNVGDYYLADKNIDVEHKHELIITENTTDIYTEPSHSHTIDKHATSATPGATSQKFSVEPEYYSLIFIMKIK